MTNILIKFVFIRLVFLFFAPTIATLFSIFRLKKIRQSNCIIRLDTKLDRRTVFILIWGLLFSLIFLFSNSFISMIIGCLMSLTIFLEPFKEIREVKRSGIYEDGIIYPKQSVTWDLLEGFITQGNMVRIINKKSGAFDIYVSYDKVDNIKIELQKRIKEFES